jgi:hypothetical protein
MADKPAIFIIGCGRSGTSLLSRMLNNHPELAVPFESHILHTFYPLLDKYGDLSDFSNIRLLIRHILKTGPIRLWHPPLDEKLVLKHIQEYNFGGVFEGILKTYMSMEGKKYWAEKTPHNVNFIKEILQIFPSAKFIYMVRDGRDVAISYQEARFGPKTIYGVSKLWNAYLSTYIRNKKHIPASQRYELRYEDLISHPDEILRKLCNFLEIDYCESMKEFYKNPIVYQTDKINAENLKKPLIADNAYKWKNKLKKSEALLFEKISQELLNKYSYETLSLNCPPISLKEKVYYGLIKEPIKRAWARCKDFQGQKENLIKITIFFELFLLRFKKHLF